MPKRLDKTILFKHCLFLLLVAGSLPAFAKDPITNHFIGSPNAFTVRGRVVDQNGNGLGGATVAERGQANNTLTTADGSFGITIQGQSAVLVVSYVGYQSKEVSVNGATSNMLVQLTANVASLDSVIVIGYGTQRKSLSTVSVSTVKGEQLAAAPVANISNALAGRASGVISRSNGGRPGADNSNIYIRGIATTGNADPLVVVDGVPRNNINEVDPNNIASVTILKDAAAVAPYGLNGANGVILITTKRGTAGAPSISVSGYYGDQKPTYVPKVLGALDYMRLKNEAVFNDKVPNPTYSPTYPQSKIDSYLADHAANPDAFPISDALGDVVKKHAPMYQGNMQIRGGTKDVKYFAGISYFNQKGLFDQSNYYRYNYNVNLDVNVTPTTLASLSINGSIQKTANVQGGTDQLYRGAYKYIPIVALYYQNGLWGENSGNSPIGVLKSGGYFYQNTNTNLSTISLEQKLPIKGLSIKGSFSYDPYNYFQKEWHQPYPYYTQNLTTNPPTYTLAYSTQESSAATYKWLNENYYQNNSFTYQGYINYHNTFGKHDITFVGVAEKKNNKQLNFRARRNNFALDADELGLGSSNKNDFENDGASSTGSQAGFLYRADYVYDKRFLFTATGRYDGHYLFAPGNATRWQFFPAFAAGWVISNEKFFESIRSVDNLKLRASFGTSGTTAGILPFQFVNAYTLYGNSYAYGSGNLVQGSYQAIEANPGITWEVAKKKEVALEGSLWKSLLRFELNVFYEKRSNMLITPGNNVPSEYGIGLARVNEGIMSNQGVELTLGSTKKLDNGIVLNFDGNLTFTKNKIIYNNENASQYANPNRRRTGRRLNAQFGYESMGLFSTADDKNNDNIINAADGYNIIQFGDLHPGDIRYKDQNGDNKIDINDETFIGNPNTPSIIYGFTAGANWKGFDLSLFFQGGALADFDIRGFQTIPFQNNNSNSAYEYYNNRWTPTHQDAKYPRATSSPYNNNNQNSDFWLVNTSYLRLKTAIIGYTLPAQIGSKIGLKNIRIYGTAQNLFTLSNIKFTDPETRGETAYPLQKVLMFGLNATF